jgi:hypothetical protein
MLGSFIKDDYFGKIWDISEDGTASADDYIVG